MDLLTQKEFAKLYGVSQPMVNKYIRQGKIPQNCIKKDGRYKKIIADCAAAALKKNLSPSRKKAQRKDAEHQATTDEMRETVENAGLNFDAPKAESERKKEAYVAALKKLEYEQKSGKMVPAEDVKKEAFELARTVRDAIINVPDRIAATVAVMDNERGISELIANELRVALENLSNE